MRYSIRSKGSRVRFLCRLRKNALMSGPRWCIGAPRARLYENAASAYSDVIVFWLRQGGHVRAVVLSGCCSKINCWRRHDCFDCVQLDTGIARGVVVENSNETKLDFLVSSQTRIRWHARTCVKMCRRLLDFLYGERFEWNINWCGIALLMHNPLLSVTLDGSFWEKNTMRYINFGKTWYTRVISTLIRLPPST